MNKLPCPICSKLIHRATLPRHEKLHDKHGFEVSRFSPETVKLFNDHVKSLLDTLLELSETSALRQIVCRPELLPTYERIFERLTPIVECDKKGVIGLHVHFIGSLNDCFKPDGSNMSYYEQRRHYGLKGNAKTNGCAILLENKLHISHALIYIMGPGGQLNNDPKYHTQPEGLKSLTMSQCGSLKKYIVQQYKLQQELAELKTTKKYKLKQYIAKKMIFHKKTKSYQKSINERNLLQLQLDNGMITQETYDKLCPKVIEKPVATVYSFKDTFNINK